MKKHILRLVGALFIITAIIMTMIPMGTRAYNAGEQGFMMEGSKLVKYSGTATAVSIPVGVTEIGSEAFAYNKNITSVTFPNTLEQIDGSAFSGCNKITTIVLPEGMTSLGSSAFANCSSLSNVSFPSSLKDLGYGIFANCDSLSTIKIHDANHHLSCLDGALYDFNKTILYQVLPGRTSGQYIMPDTVTEVGRYALWGCDNVTSVHIGSSLTEISDYAFSNASGLTALTLPYNIRLISQKAFEDCTNMLEIIIPMSVTKIADSAFDGCYNLNMITEKGSYAEEYAKKFNANKTLWKEYEDSISRNTIKMYLEENKNLEEVTENNSSNMTPIITVNPASNVENFIEWDINSPGVIGRTKIVSGKAVVFMNNNSNVSDVTENSNIEDANLNISNGNTLIYKAFYLDTDLTNYSIPSGIRNIDDFAFARSGLTSIAIPNGVERIGDAAFYHCDQLNSVEIPSTVTDIGSDAFNNTPWFMNWMNNSTDSFLIVGDGVLIAYKGNLNEVTIPSTVKTIAPQAFKNHTEITKVLIPDSVLYICDNAFNGCNSIAEISGLNQVESIGDGAFYGCPIKTIRIPSTVKSIGLGAFGGTDRTDSVIFTGSTLPNISYGEGSTRLSASRKPIFDNIQTFVVSDSINTSNLSNTCIDPNSDFFDGVIYKISEESGRKIATLIASSKAKDETEIQKEIYVFSQPYSVENIVSTMIYGSKEPLDLGTKLNDLLKVTATNIQSDSVYVDDDNCVTKLNGYHMYISDCGEQQSKLISAIEKYYGSVNDNNSLLFDISLFDQTDEIPIKELGKNRIGISIPVPANMVGKEVCAVTLGKNGTPEVLLCTIDKKNDKEYATFYINHCSSYALFAPEGELKETITVKNQNSSGGSNLDNTPNTGDHTPINLILAIGIGCFGLFLLLTGIFNKKIG